MFSALASVWLLFCASAAALGSLRTAPSDTVLRRGLLQTGPFAYPTYANVEAKLKILAEQHPYLVQVYDAQSKYGLGSPRAQCTGANGARGSCRHWVAVLTNRSADSRLTPLSDRPQMFLSGNLHGNEWVGPVTVLNLLELLVASATADSSSPLFNTWLHRLVNTRTLIAMPVTNPAGYDAKQREEDSVDPNRDFPIFRLPRDCMVTIAARAVNEVWRDSLIQTSLTYHGGMQALCYEWGAAEHYGAAHNSESPDDSAQNDVAGAMRAAAGAFNQGHYPTGTCNDMVYPVDGGMEDWAYAGSWDPLAGARKGCNPTSNGGYPPEKTIYTDGMLRSFNMLVEAADDKIPEQSTLGSFTTVEELLTVQGAGDGHVPRNIRLALTMMELVEPYVLPSAVRTHAHGDGQHRSGGRPRRQLPPAHAPVYKGPGPCSGACPAVSAEGYAAWVNVSVQQPSGSTSGEADAAIAVSWHVGGAMHVDETAIVVGTWDPRVPAALFEAGQPVIRDPGAGSTVGGSGVETETSSVDEAFVHTLTSLYGLTEDESRAFALYLHAWQRVYRGELSISELVSLGYALNTTEASSGPTGWVFNGGTSSATATYPAGWRLGDDRMGQFTSCVRVNAGGTDGGAGASVSLGSASCDSDDERMLLQQHPLPVVAGKTGQGRTLQQSKVVRSLLLMPFARVDSSWARQRSPNPVLPPQAHLTNVRTNPTWRRENAGYVVRGRYQWAARPLLIGLESTLSADPSPSLIPSATPTVSSTSTSTLTATSTATSTGAGTNASAGVTASPSSAAVSSTPSTVPASSASGSPTLLPTTMTPTASGPSNNSTSPPWLIVIPLEMNAGVGVASILLLTVCIVGIISRKRRIQADSRYAPQRDVAGEDEEEEEEEDDGQGPTAADVEIVLADSDEDTEGMARARPGQGPWASSTPVSSSRPPLGPGPGQGTSSKNKSGAFGAGPVAGAALAVGRRQPLGVSGRSSNRHASEDVEIELGDSASAHTAIKATLAQASPQLRPAEKRYTDSPELLPAGRQVKAAAPAWEDEEDDEDADIGRGSRSTAAVTTRTAARPTASQLDAQLEAALDELDEQVSDDDTPLTRSGPALSASAPVRAATGPLSAASKAGKGAGSAMALGKKAAKAKD